MNRIENGVIHSEIAAHVFGNTIDSSQNIVENFSFWCTEHFMPLLADGRVYLLKTELTLQKS